MDRCDWLEREGLLAEERGEPIAHHLDGCADCQQRHAQIAQLRADLGRIEVVGPPERWQAMVWQRIDRSATARRKIVLWFALPVAAAAALLIFVIRRPVVETGDPLLAVAFEHDPQRPRTRGDVAVGDSLRIDGTSAAELRVYREGTLAFRCDGPPACSRVANKLSVRWTIPAIGHYRVVLLAGAVPAPGKSLDEDAAAATTAGAVWRESDPIEIW
jgi:hypothetical protein